jgi:hypothetical protein
MADKKEETAPTPEAETPIAQDKLEYTDEVPAELRDAEMDAEAAAAEKAEAEPKPEEKLAITAEEEAPAETPAEEAAVAPAKEEEKSFAEQLQSVREVYDARFEQQKSEFEARLAAQQQQMEQQYAPLVKATKKQEQEQAQSEAVQNFHKALGPDFEERTGVSPQTAQAIATAAMQHLLPADPFMRDTRTANENAVYRDAWSKFDTSVANQVEAALKTTEVSQESRQKGMDVYNELRATNPQMGLTEAAKRVAEVIVEAERGNGKPATAATEPAPPPTPKASVTSAAPPKRGALTEEEEFNLDFAGRVAEEERRLRRLDQIEKL